MSEFEEKVLSMLAALDAKINKNNDKIDDTKDKFSTLRLETRKDMREMSQAIHEIRVNAQHDCEELFAVVSHLQERLVDPKQETQDKSETVESSASEARSFPTNVTIRNSVDGDNMKVGYDNYGHAELAVDYEQYHSNPLAYSSKKSSPASSVKSNTNNDTYNIKNSNFNNSNNNNAAPTISQYTAAQPQVTKSVVSTKTAKTISKTSASQGGDGGDGGSDDDDDESDPVKSNKDPTIKKKSKASKPASNRRTSYDFLPPAAPTVPQQLFIGVDVKPKCRLKSPITAKSLQAFWQDLEEFCQLNPNATFKTGSLIDTTLRNQIASRSRNTMTASDVLTMDVRDLKQYLADIVRPKTRQQFVQRFVEAVVFPKTVKELNILTFGEFNNHMLNYITDFLEVYQVLSERNEHNEPGCYKDRPGSIWLFNHLIPFDYGTRVYYEITKGPDNQRIRFNTITEYIEKFSAKLRINEVSHEHALSFADFLQPDRENRLVDTHVQSDSRPKQRLHNIQQDDRLNAKLPSELHGDSGRVQDSHGQRDSYSDDDYQRDNPQVTAQLAALGQAPPRLSVTPRTPCYTAIFDLCRNSTCKHSHNTAVLLEYTKRKGVQGLDTEIRAREKQYPYKEPQRDKLHALSAQDEN